MNMLTYHKKPNNSTDLGNGDYCDLDVCRSFPRNFDKLFVNIREITKKKCKTDVFEDFLGINFKNERIFVENEEILEQFDFLHQKI